MRRRPDLRPEGIAGIVFTGIPFDRPARPNVDPGARRPLTLAKGSLAGIVLGAPVPARGPLLAAGLVATVAVQVAALAAARHHLPPPLKHVPAQREKSLQIDHIVELPSPVPIAPPQPSTTHRSRAAPIARAAANVHEPAVDEAPPPAAAGQVVTAAPEQAEAVDFTGFDVATGPGTSYAGGITAPGGTSTGPGASGGVDPQARAGASGRGSRARAVGLPATEWRCPWPRDAEALSIDEETVILRVVVRTDGSAAAAELVSDPGHGFGDVALACARTQHFPPARDDAGRPITATSPPIRVRFTRPGR